MLKLGIRTLAAVAITLCLALAPLAAVAGDTSLRIVLTNDDGFETPNIQALFNALIAAGHDVIMSAPYSGQSGQSGALDFLQPILPTGEPSEGGLLPAGSFGIGETTIAPDQYYVDGRPVAAVLYGIDVLAQERWGSKPDLVLSGPNEGNNVGHVNNHSGTVAAAVAALNKGIPAIALSADSDEAAEAEIVAALTLQLVDELNRRGRIQLPPFTGLNVNFPPMDAATQSADDFGFELTNIGRAASIGVTFYENLGDGVLAQAVGIPPTIGLPGVGIEAADDRLGLPPVDVGHPADNSPRSEWNALGAGDVVTVSVIDSTYAASIFKKYVVGRKLRGLLY